MHVEPQPLGEDVVGDDQPVGDCDDDGRSEVEPGREALGFDDRQAELVDVETLRPLELALVPRAQVQMHGMSALIAGIMLAVYVANVAFTLFRSRADAAAAAAAGHGDLHHGPAWSPGKALAVLFAVTLGIIWLSEILVGTVEAASEAVGFSDAFTGVFVLAVIGGAAEQATAIVAARQNRMDLAMSIALGASVQLALLVAPLLVLLSYVIGPHPMGLVFGPGLVLTILFSVLITGQIASDGRTDWLRGVQLLAVYLILAAVFFYVPDVSGAK